MAPLGRSVRGVGWRATLYAGAAQLELTGASWVETDSRAERREGGSASQLTRSTSMHSLSVSSLTIKWLPIHLLLALTAPASTESTPREGVEQNTRGHVELRFGSLPCPSHCSALRPGERCSCLPVSQATERMQACSPSSAPIGRERVKHCVRLSPNNTPPLSALACARVRLSRAVLRQKP